MKIRTARARGVRATARRDEVDLAEPKAGEELVRLVACGVCDTDLYTVSGRIPAARRGA